MYCVKCGAENPDSSRYCQRCGSEVSGASAPAATSQSDSPQLGSASGGFQVTPYGGAAATWGQAMGTVAYKGVGIRFVALLIDGIILGVLDGILIAASRNAGMFFLISVIPFLYWWLLEGAMGQTIGKKAVGIKVVREDGGPVGYGPSFIRNILRIVDGIFVYLLGAIIIWTNERRQRLGDMAARTVVISAR